MLAITELWRNQSKYQTRSKSLIVSEQKILTTGRRKGQPRYPDDKAAGVPILLSQTTTRKIKIFGSEDERVCWVRLKGPTCNIFVIAVYLPHRGRVSPCQADTMRDLEAVLAKVPKRDCVCIMGDLNEQIQGNVKDRSGKWVGGPPSTNADSIMQLMHLHSLTAINTLFQPPRQGSVNTYLHTQANSESGDLGEFVGDKVIVTYRGKKIKGRVCSTYANAQNKQIWVVKFDDGYVKKYTRRTSLQSILVRSKAKKLDKQIDYILVSTHA